MRYLSFLVCGLLAVAIAEPLGTAFTYQGRLTQFGQPANGIFDFQFQLFDVDMDGIGLTAPVLLEDVVIADGIFSVELDFGLNPFFGDKLWLAIAVREGASTGEYTGLLPRQAITPAPFALHTLSIEAGAITSIEIASGAVGTSEIDDSQVQRRVTGTCPPKFFMAGVNQDGTVNCAPLFATYVIEKQTVPDGASEAFGFSGDVTVNLTDDGQFVIERVPGTYAVSETDLPADWELTEIVCDDTNSSGDVGAGLATIRLEPSETVTCVFTNTDLAVSTLTVEKQTNPDGASAVFVFSGEVSGQLSDGGLLSVTDLIAGTYSVTESIIPWSWTLTGIACDDANSTGDLGSATATFVVEYAENVKCTFMNASLGGSITTVAAPPGGAGIYSSIAIGDDGLPVISYRDFSATDTSALMVAKCNDAACSGGDETLSIVDENTDFPGWDTSIAIGSDGSPVIAYWQFGSNPAASWTMKIAKCNDPACTGGDETVSVLDMDGLRSPSIAVGPDTFPVISYFDFNGGGVLLVAKCNDTACTGNNETITTVDDDAVLQVGSGNSIAIGSDGFPVISYLGRGNLTVAKCNDAACSGGDETITGIVAVAGFTGHTSIAIGSDTFPRIAYADGGSLKLIKCNDVACSGADESVSIVETPADPPLTYPRSMNLDGDDKPVIAYMEDVGDTGFGILKVVACNDDACTGGDETITVIDPLSDGRGRDTSLAIGDDGLPIISYMDNTLQILKVAHCSAADCSQ